jgi:hypothetical protein
MASKISSRKIIIEVKGDLSSPLPDLLLGKSVSLSLDGPKITGFQADLRAGNASQVVITVKCASAEIEVLEDPEVPGD